MSNIKHKRFLTELTTGEDLEENEFIVRMTGETKDRHGTVIDLNTLKTDNFKKNPVLLYAHEDRSIPVGKVKDFWKEGKSMYARVEVDGHTEFEELLIKKLNAGSLNACSIGFSPQDATMERKKDDEKGEYILVKGAELIELSIASIGSNPDALVLKRSLEEALDVNNVSVEEINTLIKTFSEAVEVLREFTEALTRVQQPVEEKTSRENKELAEKIVEEVSNDACTKINKGEDSEIDDLYRDLIDLKKEERSGEQNIYLNDIDLEDIEF